MKEVKIQIPDNCELVKDGDSYVVREIKQRPPRSWEEFCEKYPIEKGEAYIDFNSEITVLKSKIGESKNIQQKNICTSKEEAEAFLALMQLRQLRKAWVGDWMPNRNEIYAVVLVAMNTNRLEPMCGYWEYQYTLSFPTLEMAEDFLSCFKDLCETAKILL